MLLTPALSRGNLRVRLGDREAIVAIVEAGDQVAGVDVLVVGDRNGRDITRNLRRDGELPGRKERVVGRLKTRGVVQVEIAACGGERRERQGAGDKGRTPPDTARLRALVGRRGRPSGGRYGRRLAVPVVRSRFVASGKFKRVACRRGAPGRSAGRRTVCPPRRPKGLQNCPGARVARPMLVHPPSLLPYTHARTKRNRVVSIYMAEPTGYVKGRWARLQASSPGARAIDMAETATGRGRAVRPGDVRPGRPRREFAGEVEERILDAASRVFLERGFDGASIDEIAVEAHAGKPTIYARFPGKEALFSAVVAQKIRQISRLDGLTATGSSSEQRLRTLAIALLERALASDAVALVRVAVAESRRFPDLAATVGRMARERGNQAVAKLLGELARSDEMAALPAFAPENLPATTRRFTEMIVLPIVMRALFGENFEVLGAEVAPHVSEFGRLLPRRLPCEGRA